MSPYQNSGHTTLLLSAMNHRERRKINALFQASDWVSLPKVQRCARKNYIVSDCQAQSDLACYQSAKCMHAVCPFLDFVYVSIIGNWRDFVAAGALSLCRGYSSPPPPILLPLLFSISFIVEVAVVSCPSSLFDQFTCNNIAIR
jgi:hypothetical protein